MYALIYAVLYEGLGRLGRGYLQGVLETVPQVLRDNEALGGVKSYTWIFNYSKVSTPKPGIV